MITTISSEILSTLISGVNLSGATLGEELGSTPTLLVFVRHFGCIFCREMIKDIRNATAKNPDYPPTIFVYQGTVEQGGKFFDEMWATARAISDTPLTLYKGFGVERGGVKEMFGSGVWSCGLRALTKGNMVGMPVGDPWVMPGIFYVQSNDILWKHDFAHAGDHPDFDLLPTMITQ